VPHNVISKNALVADFGAGSGRWAKIIAPLVKKLICIEPSEAIEVCDSNLAHLSNVDVRRETIEDCSIEDTTLDFAYSLGVLHHIPDTQKALRHCVKKLKLGSPILIYLYYRFDNKPMWFQLIWNVTNIIRHIVSRLPKRLKFIICDLIAIFIYLPFARFSKWINKAGISVENLPLSFYKDSTFIK
jgi:2-polyprenyl-3-methyl-5-hydroxy-6-metoxy-1,4-benzoquinol methylase